MPAPLGNVDQFLQAGPVSEQTAAPLGDVDKFLQPEQSTTASAPDNWPTLLGKSTLFGMASIPAMLAGAPRFGAELANATIGRLVGHQTPIPSWLPSTEQVVNRMGVPSPQPGNSEAKQDVSAAIMGAIPLVAGGLAKKGLSVALGNSLSPSARELAGIVAPNVLTGAASGAAGQEVTQRTGNPTLGTVAGALTAGGLVAGSKIFNSDNLGRIANGISDETLTADNLGNNLKAAARDWLDNRGAMINEPFDNISKIIPNNTPVDLSPLQNYLKSALTKKYGNKNLGIAKNLSDEMEANQLANVPNTWEDWQEIRKTLGDSIRDPKVDQSLKDRILRPAYAQLQDIGRGVATQIGGQPLADELDSAFAQAQAVHQVAKNTMGKLLPFAQEQAGEPGGGVTLGKILSEAQKTGSTLQELRKEMPEQVDNLAAYVLRRDPRRPGGWFTLSPEAQEALVPDVATRLRINKAASKPDNALTGIQNAVEGTLLLELGKEGVEGARALINNELGNAAQHLGTVGLFGAPYLFRQGIKGVKNLHMGTPLAQGALATVPNQLTISRNGGGGY